MDRINEKYKERKSGYISLIEDEHSFYTRTISKNSASLECCSYLLSLYDSLNPVNILDLGSGISSYSLRLFKKLFKLETDIWSIDTNLPWLEKSKRYCSDNGLDSSNFLLWDDFKNLTCRFDLIFIDIGMSPERHLFFDPVFTDFTKEGTVVLLDDMHKSIIVNPFNNFMKNKPYTQYDIKEFTLDGYGRFSILVKV